MPQSRFLEFITDEAKRYASFRLVMGANVRELVLDGALVRGVRYQAHDGWHEVRVVKVAGDEIATRSYRKIDAIVRNRGREVIMLAGSDCLAAKCSGAKGFRLMDGARVVATSADGMFPPLSVGPGPVDLLVIADFDEPAERIAALGDAFRVEARIAIWKADDVLRVPASAPFRDGEDWFVFQNVDGVARKTKISLGRRNAMQAEIVGGLSEGNLVVAFPNDLVRDGVSLTDRRLRTDQ